MKKTMMVLLALSLACILAVGSTMSYLTYTDYDVNTMVVGNVKIQQLEQKRDDSAFDDDNAKLMPVVEVADTEMYKDQYTLFNHKNIVDKIVTVENTGSEAAYIRTVFAFEMKKIVVDDDSITWENPVTKDVILNDNGINLTDLVIYKNAAGAFTTNDTDAVAAYVIGWYLYNDALAKDTTSTPSLLQVYLASSVGNEFFEAVGNEYDILVLSQAVQTTGFDTAADALHAAFGDVTAENAAQWFAEIKEETT